MPLQEGFLMKIELPNYKQKFKVPSKRKAGAGLLCLQSQVREYCAAMRKPANN